MAKALGERLRHIRANTGRDQPGMASLLGVAPRTYSNYERGERFPDADALERLVAEGWNANWILSGKGPERMEAVAPASAGSAADRNTLKSAIETVESALDLAGVPFSPRGKAELIATMYRHLLQKKLSAESVAQALRMIREALKSGAS